MDYDHFALLVVKIGLVYEKWVSPCQDFTKSSNEAMVVCMDAQIYGEGEPNNMRLPQVEQTKDEIYRYLGALNFLLLWLFLPSSNMSLYLALFLELIFYIIHRLLISAKITFHLAFSKGV